MEYQTNVEEMLLVSSPGVVGGLSCVFEDKCLIISLSASTGIFLDSDKLVVAHQFDEGRSIQFVDRGRSRHCLLSENSLDMHDVLIKGNSLFIVDTENNQVVEFDLAGMNTLNRWGLPGEPDSAHMNSITFYQGKLLASIFGRFVKNRGYKLGTEGLGQIIDVKTGEIFIEGLSQPHSLTVEGDLLYLCNSEAKELHIYEGSILKEKVMLPGYTRGIAIGREKIYVGISQSRNAEVAKEKLTGSIVVLNHQTLVEQASVKIPFSEIYDIRLIGLASDLVLKIVSIGDKEQLMQESARLLKAYEETEEAYKQTKEAYKQTKEAYKQTKDNYEKLNNPMQWLAKSMLSVLSLVVKGKYKPFVESDKHYKIADEHYKEAYEHYKEAYEQTKEAYEQTREAYEPTKEAYEQTKEAYEQTKEAYEQTKEAYEQIKDFFSDSSFEPLPNSTHALKFFVLLFLSV